MKKLLFLLLLACAVTVGFTQSKIALADVSKHVGDNVMVEGSIYGIKVFKGNSSAPVLLSLGADFPNQLLTVAVFPSYKEGEVTLPTEKDKGNVARVVGKIELVNGGFQIAVRGSNQLFLQAEKKAQPIAQPNQ